jgi:hypothetical protein
LAIVHVPQAANDDCLTSAHHQEIAMCDYCGCRTQPSIARFGDEHEQFDLALRPIAGGVASASEWAALPRAIEGLRAHIWTEEFDVFPAALQLLGPSAWQRVDDGCGTSRASPPSAPEHRSEQRVTYR